MEQPSRSQDDLQPQDLSTSAIQNVVDLTKKGSQNVMSCIGQHLIHRPDWHSTSGLLETTSLNASHQSTDQIQPDNALSNTTVTLSYVSRSHIYSTSQPLTGLQPICKFPLAPSSEAEKRIGQTAYTPNQYYLEPICNPVDLATKSFHSLSKAREIDEAYLPHQLCELNGAVNLSTTTREDHSVPGSVENSEGLENGQHECRSSLGVGTELSTDTHARNDERRVRSEMLTQISKTEETVVSKNKVAAIEQCSVTKDYKISLEDPVSPAATCVDDEDVFMLPLASSSPSADNSLQVQQVAWKDSVSEGGFELTSGVDNAAKSLNSRDAKRQPLCARSPEQKPMVDLTDNARLPRISEDRPETVTSQMNSIVSPLQTTQKLRKLPMRSNRGVRLEEFIMNLNSSSYKVSGCINTNVDVSKITTWDSYATNLKRNDTLSDRQRQSKAKAKPKVVGHCKKDKPSTIKTDHPQSTTADSVNTLRKSNRKSPKFTKNMQEEVSNSDLSENNPVISKRKCSSRSKSRSNTSKEDPALPHSEPRLEKKQAKCLPPARKELPKKSRCSAKGQPISPAVRTKVSPTPKRRRKKHKPKPFPSIFAPKEPEIKLKFIHYKEKRKDFRYDNFSPFIRMHTQKSYTSLCSVVNYLEEGKVQHNRGHQGLLENSGSFISESLPSSSCLLLGRASTQCQRRASFVCCLCGLSANAMDLGDLHGPYYSEGYKPSTKKSKCSSSVKSDKDADSDSSCCSIGGRRRKRARVPPSSSHKPASQCWQISHPSSCHKNTDNTGSPAAKRACSEMWKTDVEDWYSPPVLSLDPCEYWLHEDCGIWTAGVFLVKGRIYGLVESVKVAQEMICSGCSVPGATLGCFFKGCPSKYHYRCALEADCVLIEENFSMKCKKHKDKTFKLPVGIQNEPSKKRPS
ncbi:uncharacterized protein LOC144211920 [Stigmatopora nigra]